MWRPVAVGVSVVAAAGSGVVTAFVTAHSSWGLWVALVVLVVVGAIAQAAVSAGERRSARRVSASGAGAVAVGGSAGEIRTQVRGKNAATGAPGGEDVAASGPGAVGVGGDATGPISTDVSGPEESAGS